MDVKVCRLNRLSTTELENQQILHDALKEAKLELESKKLFIQRMREDGREKQKSPKN